MDRQGCCLLQKCMTFLAGDEKQQLLSKISFNSFILSLNQYGNYVVQYLLVLKIPRVEADILAQLEGQYDCLSMQKFSSNVVEKCLIFFEENNRANIVKELINNPHLIEIMEDQYGNFVIQKALEYSKGRLRVALVEAIMPHVSALRCNKYGRKILPHVPAVMK